jgi:hypothetical protein
MHVAAAGGRAALLLLLLASGSASAGAPGVPGAARPEPCAGNLAPIGDLGIVSLDCDCIYSGRAHSTDGHMTLARRWTFRSEPEVSELRPDGPAAGRLREGDVITAIDGVLITTRDGARRFAEVAPGAVVTLTVRRDGREMPVRIVADTVCPESVHWPESGVLVMTPSVPRPPVAPEVPRTPQTPGTPAAAEAPEAPQAPEAAISPEEARSERRMAALPKPAIPTEDALPRGWSGFGLTCSNCGGQPGGDGAPPVWEFGTLPTIYFLDPGSPAARAGFQIGDVLTHLDGISLVTEEGGRRFGALKPGQNVRWTILRGGRPRVINVIPEARPGDRLPLADFEEAMKALSQAGKAEHMSEEMQRLARQMARASERMSRAGAARERLRYAGAVGGSEVEVRGLQNVVVDDSGDEIVITTSDATIRIKKAAAQAPKPEKKGSR